jgi:hypothetical protein
MNRHATTIATLVGPSLVLAFVVIGQPACSDPWEGYPSGNGEDELHEGQHSSTCDGFKAVAEGGYRISRHADFSTSDFDFTTQDTLHLEVCSSTIDVSAMKKRDLEVKAQDVKVKTRLVNDGEIFQGAVELSPFAMLVGNQRGEVKVKLEDEVGEKWELSFPITLSPPP